MEIGIATRTRRVTLDGIVRSTGSVGCVLALVLAAGCGPGPRPTGTDADPVIELARFDVEGATERAAYVADAFPAAVTVSLTGLPGLRARPAGSDGDVPPEAPTHRLTGTLIETAEGTRARFSLTDTGSGKVVFEGDTQVAADQLDVLARTVAGDTAKALGRERAPLYAHLVDLTGSPEMEASSIPEQTRAAVRIGDIGGCLELSARLVEQFPDEAASHAFRAWALMLAWDADPANEILLGQLKERLSTLRGIDADSPYDELILGYVYRSSGEPEPARAMYAHVLARTDLTSEIRAWALRQRAYTQVQTGEPDLALADAEEAVRLDPLSASSLAAASRALEATGRFDEAVERSTQAIALRPSNWRYLQRLGILLARAGRVDEGIRNLEEACRMGGNQESCANLAVVLARAGRAEDAAAVAVHAAALPASRFGQYNLACYRTLAGDHAGAIQALRGALDLGFADVLIETDPDLEQLRGTAGYAEALAGVQDRVRQRRQVSRSTFPWQS